MPFKPVSHLTQSGQFVARAAGHVQYRLQFGNLLCCQAAFRQFLIHLLQANLVQFVDSHGDVHNLVRSTHHLGDTAEYLAVIQFQAHVHTQASIHLFHDLNQFQLAHEAVCTYHIHVALIELAVTAFLRTVCAPYRLNLITFEGETDVVSILRHKPRKRHRQVIAQTFLRNLTRQRTYRAVLQLLCVQCTAPVA